MEWICPLTHEPLKAAGAQLQRCDGGTFPVIDGIPVLMGPEIRDAEAPAKDGIYAESYAERAFYDSEADAVMERVRSEGIGSLKVEEAPLLEQLRHAPVPFPDERWLTTRADLASEWDCYRHLAPIEGAHVVQLGGKGVLSFCFLLAGAARATLITPMLGEAKLAWAIAETLGCAKKFDVAVGIAEQIPLPDASADVVYSGGCVHHMTTEVAFPEIARVLKRGGRFAAIEPWRAPLYSLGVKVFGKREANPFCRPLTRDRVAPIFGSFARAQCVQHGSLSRYPILALDKIGLKLPPKAIRLIGQLDDSACSMIGLRRFGSGVALLGTK